MQAALDRPAPNEPCDALALRVQGWIYAEARHQDLVAVEVFANNNTSVGRTSLLYTRPDVCTALGIGHEVRTGFTIVGSAPDLATKTKAELTVQACFADGTRETVARQEIVLSGRDYRTGDWGILVDPAFPHLVRREHMYNSGPSQQGASGELLSLLERYLPPAGRRVLDVGCGLGIYGQALQTRGYDWFGVEMKPEDCAVLKEKGLPHRQVDGQTLPFDAGAFDAAICLEVLEHTTDPWSFIAEVRRVIRQRIVISVPNLEVVTYWRSHLAVPWHLLEADHRNFFSRASLRELLQKQFRSVEVLGYGEAPLKSAEGVALDYHLLAVADV